MDNLSKKLASNDKMLETINNKMESFSSAIKNQHSFNKMLESQISQLALSVPTNTSGKIPGKPEELESANLVDVFSAGHLYKDYSYSNWEDDTVPKKKGDPGRPVIPITIGRHTFDNALCDYGSSINIMPQVIYEKIHGNPLYYTTMCLQLADQSLCYPKGVLEDVYVQVGHSYVPTDFVVVETGGDENSPIILGRPFLNTTKAIIYADKAKITFNIKGRKEKFTFKNKKLKNPTRP
jgi:hypothetical protein